jgi:RNA polymerase sigma-70 factor (ECF subfamily)
VQKAQDRIGMSASAFQALKALLTPSDEQIMWRVQMHDDAEAFAELIRRWQGPMQGLCARMTGDLHRAQDLAQEAFARLFTRRKAYRADGKFSTYLWRIAINLCYDELRRARRRPDRPTAAAAEAPTSEVEQLSTDVPSPDEHLAKQELGEAVRQAVMNLPEHYRSIVVLRHYENLKFREIAEVLDLPEGTVKTRMTEALNELGRMLRRSLELSATAPRGRGAARRTAASPDVVESRAQEVSCVL